jgi:hypothetical protein
MKTQNTCRSAERTRALLAGLIVATLASEIGATPYESGGKVDEFVGAYTETIPITVPPFHGIEPKLSLQYHSGRGSGLLGVGWSLQGLSVIEQTEGRYSGVEPMFELDGQLLVACRLHRDWTSTGQRSPACTSGGALGSATSYSTLSESYLRIEHGNDPADGQDTRPKKSTKRRILSAKRSPSPISAHLPTISPAPALRNLAWTIGKSTLQSPADHRWRR